MTRSQYIKALQEKGYKLTNENQMSLGTLVFNICEGNEIVANETQHTFCLKLSPVSDLNLIPDPWNSNSRL